MNWLKVIVLIVALTSQNVIAGEWSGYADVLRIYPHSTNNTNGTTYFLFSIAKNPDNCTRSDLIALKKDNKLSTELYSLILTAATSKLKVNYYVGGCDSNGYPVILHAQVSF